MNRKGKIRSIFNRVLKRGPWQGFTLSDEVGEEIIPRPWEHWRIGYGCSMKQSVSTGKARGGGMNRKGETETLGGEQDKERCFDAFPKALRPGIRHLLGTGATIDELKERYPHEQYPFIPEKAWETIKLADNDIRKVPLEELLTMPYDDFVKLMPPQMKARLDIK